ncbi:MAG: hypothetical protein GTO55_05305 [Armatimonadetes bacterium]|nr:hypothetical protein [Armatimonadota bacterium]NIM23680.1 hypothetical protein [Armatimonadota bacterium]NIM67551.1 hypothetical protein [Armatimonadota bacterium]NIM76068.1 hypothetical protein [Armatimonadota bacterium]NIN05738.1 hypothetical protein [Armatimonadota bacterium]
MRFSSLRKRKLSSTILLLTLFFTGVSAFAAVPPISPTDSAGGVAQVVGLVEGYLDALRQGDWARAYELLSWPSKQLISKEEWIKSAQSEAGPAPSDASALEALLPGADSCRVTEIIVNGGKAEAVLEATYSLPSQIRLAKEGGGWRIHLAATDREAVYSIAKSFSETLKKGASEPSFSLSARRLLVPFVKSHRLEEVELQAQNARVKVVETAVVVSTLELQRQGPFWKIVSAPPPAEEEPSAAAPKKEEEKEERDWLPAPRHWRR